MQQVTYLSISSQIWKNHYKHLLCEIFSINNFLKNVVIQLGFQSSNS